MGDLALRRATGSCDRRGGSGGGSVNDAAGGLDPFTGSGDRGAGFDGGDDSVGGNLAFIGAFDDVFEGEAQVAAAFGEQAGGVGVIVDSGAVGEHEAQVDGGRALPVKEHSLDGFAFRMTADGAFALVMGKVCLC